MKSALLQSQRILQRSSAVSTRAYSASKMIMNKAGSSSKRPRVHASGGTVEGVWYTSKGARPSSLEMGRYGLSRLNYATLEPPVWTVPPHPPTKSVMERVLFPLTVVLTGAIVVWAYMNPEEDDMQEYWKRVETGAILLDDDDDDDEDWDDDDEE
jgi:hypothetical protein